MKRWSLDARSRRRSPQALCVGGEGRIRGPLALRRASLDVRGYLAQGMTVDKSSTHRENPASFGWIHGAGYAGQYTQ